MKEISQECNSKNAKISIFEANGFKSFAISSFNLSECHDIEKSSLSSLSSHPGSGVLKGSQNNSFWNAAMLNFLATGFKSFAISTFSSSKLVYITKCTLLKRI